MEKYFKCNEIIYGGKENKIQFVEVSVKYDKQEGGYCIRTAPRHYDGSCCGYVIDKDYFNTYYDVKCLVVPACRRGKKAEERANKIFEEKKRGFALHYLAIVNQRTGRNIKLCEMVN